MSAFLVSPDCINSIVTHLHGESAAFAWLKDLLNFDVASAPQVRCLAEALYRMNCDAIKERYGADALKSDLAQRGEFRFRMVRRSVVEVFKAIGCLLYQCSEGNVPEQPLFKALVEISRQVAGEVVYNLPEYERAPWGD